MTIILVSWKGKERDGERDRGRDRDGDRDRSISICRQRGRDRDGDRERSISFCRQIESEIERRIERERKCVSDKI